ncbi:hypothetical protein [Nostocoides sp. HKS02]|uniref:hypothetical protein n=1 Tax=Nostocoides sp. HKS02 TaxID=1813880 RepID=UPI0012B441F8|nr:hypothetical protein [Tetrasphaera sp. HKS02]QGN58913.1 hypothetical protein GKE56_14600 [Tetrasphaera sp. HKS02]
MTEGETLATTLRLRSTLRQLLAMLGAEFLLGMGANLIGLPSEVSGSSRVATLTLIGLHALLALGIVTVAVIAYTSARRVQLVARMTTVGLATVAVTFLAGVGTLMSGSGWLSFVMAAGFIAAMACYGSAYVEVTRVTATVPPPSRA